MEFINKKVLKRIELYNELNTLQYLSCKEDPGHQVIDIYEDDVGNLKMKCFECGWECRVPLMFYSDEMDILLEDQLMFETKYKNRELIK